MFEILDNYYRLMGNSIDLQNLNSYLHPRLGLIKRLQNYNQQQYIQYEVGVPNQKLVNQWQQILKKMLLNKCDRFLLLPLEYCFKKDPICGSQGIITHLLQLKFQDYMFRLFEEIKNRKRLQRFFPQTQIWNLIYILASVGNIMQATNEKIGDVRPQNILINQDGHIKILSQYSWPCNCDNYQLLVEQGQSGIYISPEQCCYLDKKKFCYPKGLNLSVCEVYSMGITILEVSALEDCSIIYEKKGEYINQKKIKQIIGKIKHNYSQQLINIIESMLRIVPQKRIKCSIIYDLLKPYQEKIKEFIPFVFDKSFNFLINSHKNQQNKSFVRYSQSDFRLSLQNSINNVTSTQNNQRKYTSQINCNEQNRNRYTLPNAQYIQRLNNINCFPLAPKLYPIYIANRNFYQYRPPCNSYKNTATINLSSNVQNNKRQQNKNIFHSTILEKKN